MSNGSEHGKGHYLLMATFYLLIGSALGYFAAVNLIEHFDAANTKYFSSKFGIVFSAEEAAVMWGSILVMAFCLLLVSALYFRKGLNKNTRL